MTRVPRDFTKPAPIAFATCDGRSALDRREPFVAFASTDASEAEARDILATLRLDDPADVRSADGEYATSHQERIFEDVLRRADGRFLVGFLDRRPFIETVVTDLVFTPAWPQAEEPETKTRARTRFRAAVERHLSDERRFTRAIDELEHVLSHGRPSAFLDLLDLRSDAELDELLGAKQNAILDHWDRHRPASLFALVNADATSLAFHAHEHEWGRRHRLIATTCAKASFPEACIPAPNGCGPLSWQHEVFTWHGPYRHEGHWPAWRASEETSFGEVGANAALRLAELLACAAVSAKRADEAADKIVRSELLLNYYGPEPVSKEAQVKGAAAERNDECVAEFSYRENRWYFACEQDSRLPDPSRLSHRIKGADLHSARDRLLLKLLGSGLGVGAIMPLRIEDLQVDRFNDLFDLSWSKEAPILKMDRDDASDFWDLVLANHETRGYLFSPLEDDEPYGRRSLTRAGLKAIVAARMAEFPLREDAAA